MNTPRENVCLNGTWQLAFDPANQGKDQEWYNSFPDSEPIEVPGVWEMVRPGYDGVGWYRTSFPGNPEWRERMVRLKFGAVFYFCECWLNGQYLGSHEGGFSPFEFDISDTISEGGNELVVRVINPPINHEIEGFRAGAPLNKSDLPVGKAAWYYNFGGVWQDVAIVVSDPVTVMDIFVSPLPDEKRAEVTVTVRNKGTACGGRASCKVVPAADDGQVAAAKEQSVEFKEGDLDLHFSMELDGFTSWSPENPFLYFAEVSVERDGSVLDTARARFGMREFTIHNDKFLLNGKPIILKGMLQQGMYPRTLIFPESREMLEKELRLLKDNGFNFIRAHLRPSTPDYLDMCDELGILVEGEPAIGWIYNSPEIERRCCNEVEGMIQRDRNHPSVVFWCLMNEAYHFGSFTMEEIKALTGRIARRARELDSTRLLLDTSGGAGGKGDSSGGTYILLPNSSDTAEIGDSHAYCSLPVDQAALEDYRKMGREGVLLFVSEYGAPLLPPDFHRVLEGYRPAERELGLEDYRLHKDFFESLQSRFRQAGLSSSLGSVETMIEQLNGLRAEDIRLVTATMRVNTVLAGLTFCQLADASGELFGATDVWRNPKPVFQALVDACRTPLLVPSLPERVLDKGSEASVDLSLVSEDKLGTQISYQVELDGENVQAGEVPPANPVQQVGKTALPGDLPVGRHCLETVVRRNGDEVSRHPLYFSVVEGAPLNASRVGVKDPAGSIAEMLEPMGAETVKFTNEYRDKDIPVLLDLRHKLPGAQLMLEEFGQLKKVAQVGGCAVLFEPNVTALYDFLFPSILRREPTMRTIPYVKRHPVFSALPSDCVLGHEYAEIAPQQFDSSEDVVAAGGTVISGCFTMNMWTRPAASGWGAALYTVPLGRGEIVVCQYRLLDKPGDSAARAMFADLINYAASRIRPGGHEKLLSRCIDPLDESEL